MWEIIVDKNKCSGDEECVNACPAQVFEMQDGKAEPVNSDECLGCETCVEVCPESAITVTEMEFCLNFRSIDKPIPSRGWAYLV